MKNWLMIAALVLVASAARADCPNIITAKSGLPGRFGEWTTTYDMKNGTFEARHAVGNLITGNVRGTCTDQTVVLEEFNTSNQNDGKCQLNRDGAKRFSGKCLPRGFDMRVTGF
jgi:secreted trypsin-like serine protease